MNAQRPIVETRAQSTEHGGRLDAARRLYPSAPQPWIDLSTGVNPIAYPLPALAPDVFSRLPDDDLFAACACAARRAYAVPATTEIVIGAGVQAFIQTLPRVIRAKRVAILGFTYAEYALAWMRSAAHVEAVATLDALATAEVSVIVNPNNPDGRLVAPGEIASLASTMAARGANLVIDESFMDFTPAQSVAPLGMENVILLRSFGKAYGLPGLRLGFALCESRFAGRLRAELGPWRVSGPALAIGASALADDDWRSDAAGRCMHEAARLEMSLAHAGFDVVGGTALFRLGEHKKAAMIYEHLAQHGVLTRAFREKPEWLRFGLPADEGGWLRLSDALETLDV